MIFKSSVVLLVLLAATACRREPIPSSPSQTPAAAPVQAPKPAPAVGPLPDDLTEILEPYRKIIVLLENASSLEVAEQKRADVAGRLLYQTKHQRIDELSAALAGDLRARPAKTARVEAFLAALENHPQLHDADKLAFRDIVEALQEVADATLRQRLQDDLRALDEIQTLYEKELAKIFGRFETRGIEVRREAWEKYVEFLRTHYDAKRILDEHADDVKQVAELRTESQLEMSGTKLPLKSLVLTFDDGPHAKRTDQVLDTLKKYGVKAVFFQVGQNASDGRDGKPTRASAAGRRVVEAGQALGNHSYSHALLPKLSDREIAEQLETTNRALDRLSATPVALFRPPYGARDTRVLAAVQARRMTSVLWNIDSKDWADPIPLSIADRVVRTVEGEKRGILLFHDIQQQTVAALPKILETLLARGYRFLSWNGATFVDESSPAQQTAAAEPQPAAPLYRESWAVLIGIDNYQRWPRLSFAANDARAMRDLLTSRFGFKPDRVTTLLNEEATRARILEALGDRLTDATRINKEDRVFVFFAGHGATRTLPNGRAQGYIVPVDADATNYHSQAISMSNFQDIADAIPAKHVLFVTDACYGGLALTRGGAQSYLQQVTRRTARQILTAGGADEQVADNGPNGHSIFTWTLMQGLEGRGDLNSDGFITASELASYIGPIVSALSRQTPAFGALAGSEGGEFVFQISHETEALSDVSAQLDEEAISLNRELERLRKTIADKRSRNERLRNEVERARAEAEGTAPPRNASAEANDRGMALYREKRYTEAAAAFEEAVRLAPRNALAANNAGFTYFKMKRFAEAVAWFERTLTLDPNRAIAHANLGDAYLALGRTAEARPEFETYLRVQPNGAAAATVRKRLSETGATQ